MIDYSEEVMELRTEIARLREAAQMALDALERVSIVDDDCDILAPSLADAVSDAIEALRKELK